MRRLLIRKTFAIGLAVCMAFAVVPGFAWGETGGEAGQQLPDNGIPVVVIHVDEEELYQDEKGNWYGTIADMNGSEDHSVRCKGSVELIVPDGYEGYGDSDLKPMDDGKSLLLSYIRGRGNSTWVSGNKKPYKIKFDKKQNLFGMGADKEWALMANTYDPTLIKNRITSWLGEQMGLPGTPKMVPVDVVMEGSSGYYKELGSYCLSELASNAGSRGLFEELGSDVTDETGDPNITGGYLVSVFTEGQDSDESVNSRFTTEAEGSFFVRSPEYKDADDPDHPDSNLTQGQKKQLEYIRGTFQEIEDLIMKPGTEDGTIPEEVHNQIAEKMDLQSAADYWLIQEFSQNGDAFCTSSTYLYKKRDGKLYWGPLWDFDLAYGDQSDEGDSEGAFDQDVSGFNYTESLWLDRLRQNDPLFVNLIQERWEVLHDYYEQMSADGGLLDQYCVEMTRSHACDYELWHKVREDLVEDYASAVGQLKEWIELRKDWFNEHYENDLGKVNVTITFKSRSGDVISTVEARKGSVLFDDIAPEAPEIKGMVFDQWYEETSGAEIDFYKAEEDTTFVAGYLDTKNAVKPTGLFFDRYEIWTSSEGGSCLPDTIRILPDTVTINRIKWSSSNADVVMIGSDGEPMPADVGDAVITGTLFNGVSKSIKVHVYDPEVTTPVDPQTLKAASDTMTLKVGQIKQVRYTLGPTGKALLPLYGVIYTSSNESVAEVETLGIIKGVKPGKAVITIKGQTEAGKVLKATCTVTVKDTAKAKETAKTEKIKKVKKANPMKVKIKKKKVKVKYKKLKKHKVNIKRSKFLKVTGAKGAVTYTKVTVQKLKNKKYRNKKAYVRSFKVDKKTGKITICKGVKKGTYRIKIKVRAAGTKTYKPLTRTVTIKIKVKK